MSKKLETQVFGKEIYRYEEVTSTNEVARNMAKEGASEGLVVIADSQNKGRGRLGRSWQSPKGQGVWMSVITRPQIQVQDIPAITLITGLAVCKAIRQTTSLPAYIKWPNDIVVDGKKVCGILTQMSGDASKINYVIIGIGINVNIESFPEELEEVATSLKIEGGQNYDREEISISTLEFLELYYKEYIKVGSLENVLDKYKDLCITLKNQVLVLDDKKPYKATPLDIDKRGGLIVVREDGGKETIKFGEVSVRGIYGYA
ncbi:MAG: biotin--[acetyl-CoA-carboxylase] ligase [Epulopiscium sp.]|nr:biotin--[acetyl-CoA-carboxylase] ligase [Candidatus Epulonipiscium sp.]